MERAHTESLPVYDSQAALCSETDVPVSVKANDIYVVAGQSLHDSVLLTAGHSRVVLVESAAYHTAALHTAPHLAFLYAERQYVIARQRAV